MLLQMSLVF